MKKNPVFYLVSLLSVFALSCSTLSAAQHLQLVDNRTLPLQKPPPLQPMKPLTPNPPITPQPFKPSTPSMNNQQTTNNNQNTINPNDNQRMFNHNQGVIYYYNPPYYYQINSPVGTYYHSYVVTTPSSTTVISQGTWVEASDGAIPDRAISYINKDGLIAYHCRALYHDRMYFGEIVGGQYCVYRDETTTLELRTYEVQVAN